MKKLLFFDIDGTIVSEDASRTIPASTHQALQALHQNGHLCFVNTGRSYAEVDSCVRDMEFDGFICGCGTNILYQNEELFANTIPFSLGNKIIQDLESCSLEWLLEGHDSVYYSNRPYRTHIGDFKREHLTIIPDACRIVPPEKAKDLTFDKFCVCLHKDSNFSDFQAKYKDILTFIDRKNNFYEIMPRGFSKASGIRFLENYFKISQENTIAVGDSTNDLSMLEYAGFSIAMGNGAKELFPVVDYVTQPLLKDGIFCAMKHLELI
ncbi:MAG: HAD family hydrolase [Clostridiaceae bacterium]|nr:HAD family hydrolase [Clostridiaceae bacterium]